MAKSTADKQQVSGLLDGDKLHEQTCDFQSLAMHFASRVTAEGAGSTSVKSRADKLALFWQAISTSPRAPEIVGEFILLAKLLITVVSGSVADERVFSAWEYVKNTRRNRLKDYHLEACVRMKSQTFFTLETFPFQQALAEWHDGATERGRYMAA